MWFERNVERKRLKLCGLKGNEERKRLKLCDLKGNEERKRLKLCGLKGLIQKGTGQNLHVV